MNRETASLYTFFVVMFFCARVAPAAVIINLDAPLFSGGVQSAHVRRRGGDAQPLAYCSASAAATLPNTAEFCANIIPAVVPQPSITATLKAYPIDISGISDNANESTATGELVYFFAVLGPATTAPVPVSLKTYTEVDYSAGSTGFRYNGGIRMDAADFAGGTFSYERDIGPGFLTSIGFMQGYAKVGSSTTLHSSSIKWICLTSARCLAAERRGQR